MVSPKKPIIISIVNFFESISAHRFFINNNTADLASKMLSQKRMSEPIDLIHPRIFQTLRNNAISINDNFDFWFSEESLFMGDA
jgi:hypothetical protein